MIHCIKQKGPEKSRRYAPTKGNQEKTDRIIDIIEKRKMREKERKREKKREKDRKREKQREKEKK